MTVKFFNDINTPRMKNFLHFDMMQKINNCLAENHLLGEYFTAFQTAFMDDFTRLDQAMLISRKSLLTPEIQKLDTQRVQEWRIVRSAARESMKLPGQASADAADFVMSLINNHGDIQAMKVTERTGALTNLCQDLTEQYADQVAAIGLTGFAAHLSATNALYLSKYEERLHEWSEYTDGEVQAARAAIDTSLENLCIAVAYGILTQGFAPYKHFVDYTNEAIKIAKIAMGVSTTKPEGGEDSSETETGNPNEQGSPSTPTAPSEPPTTEPSEPGGGTTEPQYSVATFNFFDGRSEELRQLVGSLLNAPANTEGYRWVPAVPSTMPATNTTYNEEAVGAEKYTVAWYLPNGNPIIWYELSPGETIPEAPEPPEGYYWPPYPSVMPSRDLDIIPEPING